MLKKLLLTISQLTIIHFFAWTVLGMVLLLLLPKNPLVQVISISLAKTTTTQTHSYFSEMLPISHSIHMSTTHKTELKNENDQTKTTLSTKMVLIPLSSHTTLEPNRLLSHRIKPNISTSQSIVYSLSPKTSKTYSVSWPNKPPETKIDVASSKTLQLSFTRPNSVTIFQNTTLSGTIPVTKNNVINEPTAINRGSIVVYTGNQYAALSFDGGNTFTFIDPSKAFPNDFNGFCCDQDTVYDASRDMMVWILTYYPDEVQNQFRLVIAPKGKVDTNNWYYYNFESDLGTYYDYPHLTLSDNYLWITASQAQIGTDSITNTTMFKISLDELKAAPSVLYGWKFDTIDHNLNNINFQATHGATQTMYWASHNSASSLKVFTWPEDSTTVTHDDIDLSPPWHRNLPACVGPDGRDWCGRVGDRVMTGWLSHGTIGFMWTSSQGGDFPYPYIEVIRLEEESKDIIDRPIIWSTNTAFAYPAASPNARGDLAFSLFMGGGAYYPTGLVGFNQALDGKPVTSTWELTAVASSSQGPDGNVWGDYVSVRPFAPSQQAWLATTFNLNGCGDPACLEPRLVVFGYETDRKTVTCYLSPGTCVFVPLLFK